MIWFILIVVVAYMLFRFFLALNKDNDDLRYQILSDKFSHIVNRLNNAAFDGLGEITILDKRSFNLYEDGQNQIINFTYGTGNLTIRWKYKYFQKEVIYEKTFNSVRNLSLFEQERVAELVLQEMRLVVEQHRRMVLAGL